MRAAIGASAGQLIRQVAVEALLTSMMGAVLGLALARVALRILPGMLPPGMPFLTRAGARRRRRRVGIRVGGLGRVDHDRRGRSIACCRRHRHRAACPSVRGPPCYRGLVVSQIAATMALVVVAALLAQSLSAVHGREPGFRIDGVLVADLGLPSAQSFDAGRVARLEESVLASVLQVQGVQAAAIGYDHPFEANWSEAPTLVGDVTRPEDRTERRAPDCQSGLLRRTRRRRDRRAGARRRRSARCARCDRINEAFAGELGGRVLGRRIRTSTPQGMAGATAPAEFEIVGVVRNERFRGLEQPSQPAFYLSTRQFPQTDVSILARTSSDDALDLATRVRAAVRAVDRAITFDSPTTLDRILAEQLVARRMTTGVIGGLAGAALALAALGLYGLLTVLVAARRRDIGVRLALGASPQRVARGRAERGPPQRSRRCRSGVAACACGGGVS